MSYYNYNYPTYVSIEDKKRKIPSIIKKLKKTNPNLMPITIEGNKITKTWWGKAWCDNLKNYNDYSNRLPRGRSYVKNGFVLHLEIDSGIVKAIVYGTSTYHITIKIAPLKPDIWNKISLKVSNNINNLSELIAGKFPRDLSGIFTQIGDGLFPTPKDINMSCSCPDYAVMCKHVAAVMYGIGNRLDDDPLLFFKLRCVDPHDLLRKTVEDKMACLLKNANTKTARVITNADIDSLFGL
ncbi:MAG: SWIM zinc finger family protein [Christensenellaceae bacterium]|jgi:uncharacterized Zn finger protein|nr:SWIM zinc finger family protein [Christensenellaceae bacterium]